MSTNRSKFRAVGAAVLAIPLLVGMATTPALAATPPAGAYADAYGLLVDVTALEGSVPVQVPEQARASSSCPPATGTKVNSLINIPADPLATVDVVKDTATTNCTAKSAKA
ncbi:MAG: hypothetical protein M3P04_07920, partial [Actinomycetota bacterium]|nr:hypothetical protein [Actinomycetota bacterium]